MEVVVMGLRNVLFGIALGSFVVLAGCAPSDESDIDQNIDTNEAELDVDCDEVDVCPDDGVAPKASIATLVSFDAATGALTYTVGSSTFTSTVNAQTRGRLSPLVFWPPTPIRPVVTRWNALVKAPGPALFGSTQANGDNFKSLTASLAASGVKMSVKLRGNFQTVKALRPLP
jgi:hypothetical protein